MPICPSCGKATRVGFTYSTEGDRRSKVRACRKCEGTFLSTCPDGTSEATPQG